MILDANERIGRLLAQALGLAPALHARPLLGAAGLAASPRRAWASPTKDELADYLEAYAARFDLPVRTGVQGGAGCSKNGRPVRARRPTASGSRPTTSWSRRAPTGRLGCPTSLPSSTAGIRAARLDRVPESVPASGGGRARRRRRELGRRDRARRGRCPHTWLSGPDTGQIPVRTGAFWTGCSRRRSGSSASHVLTTGTPVGRRVRPQAADHGRTARAGAAEGARRGRDRARAADDRCPGRAPAARGRTRHGRRERHLVHGIPAGLLLDRPARLRRRRRAGARTRRRRGRAGALLRRALLPVRDSRPP